MMGVARWDKHGMHFWTSLSEQHFTNRHVVNTFFLHHSSQIITNQTVGYMLIAPFVPFTLLFYQPNHRICVDSPFVSLHTVVLMHG